MKLGVPGALAHSELTFLLETINLLKYVISMELLIVFYWL